MLKEVGLQAEDLSAAIVAAANLTFPPMTDGLRIIDREGRVVFARQKASHSLRLGQLKQPVHQSLAVRGDDKPAEAIGARVAQRGLSRWAGSPHGRSNPLPIEPQVVRIPPTKN